MQIASFNDQKLDNPNSFRTKEKMILQSDDSISEIVRSDDSTSESLKAPKRPQNNQLKLVSYNLLADIYTESNSEYDYVEKKHLEWNTRKRLIFQRIRKSQADIVCLQEVSK
eukprot:Awhi_evm1s2977